MKDDYYSYNEATYEMIGERTNRHYKLGQTVKIKVMDVDMIRRTIDFELVVDGQKKRDLQYN